MKFISFDKQIFENDKKNVFILILIGFFIRFVSISYGLPSTYNSTEYFIAKHALSMGARQSLEPLYYIYPTFYTYFITLLYTVYFVFGKIIGWFPQTSDFAVQFLADPSAFYLVGRSLNAILVILAGIFFYFTIRFILSASYSLLITLLLYFSYNIFNFTFWMVPDGFLIWGIVIVLYFITKNYFHPLPFNQIVIAAFVCGLTISAKYNSGFLALGFLMALTSSKNINHKVMQRLLLGILFIFAGFIIGSPFWILQFTKFISGFKMILAQSQYSYNIETGLPYLWEFRELVTSEWILGILYVMLMFSLFIKINYLTLPLLFIAMPTFLIVGLWEKKGLDYLIVIFPTLLILLAFWVNILISNKSRRRMIIGIIFLAVSINFLRILYLQFLHHNPDTRKLASSWIIENIVPGDSICYDHYHYDLDLIDTERYTIYGQGSRFLSRDIKLKISALAKAPNNYRFVSSQLKLNRPLVSDSLFKVVVQDSFLWQMYTHPHKTIEEIVSGGISALILNSDTYEKYLNNPTPPLDNPMRNDFLSRREFYGKTLKNYTPVKIFRPNWHRPGPIIQIYDLRGI